MGKSAARLDKADQGSAVLAGVSTEVVDLSDPAAPKVVPKDRWFAAPAAVELSGVNIR